VVRWLASLVVLLGFTALCGGVAGNEKVIGTCATTLEPHPQFVPPSPYQQDAPSGQFWYGSDSLWTLLGITGIWNSHRNVHEDAGVYTTKLVYWRQGFDWRKEVDPELSVVAKRLDREAPQIRAGPARAVFVTGPRPAMMTGIDIPSAGCWELTAEYHEHKLSFVVSAQP
jgi:hypothetical protein